MRLNFDKHFKIQCKNERYTFYTTFKIAIANFYLEK